jgi:hypothetical protein
MNVSEGLKQQLDNLDKKGYFRLTHVHKLELEKHLGEKMNRSCADCVKSQMFKLIKKNKVQEPRTPVIHFIGVKQ